MIATLLFVQGGQLLFERDSLLGVPLDRRFLLDQDREVIPSLGLLE
jgi:hypothetical protein